MCYLALYVYSNPSKHKMKNTKYYTVPKSIRKISERGNIDTSTSSEQPRVLTQSIPP